MNLNEEMLLILEAIHSPILIINSNGIIIFINEAYTKMTGFYSKDVIGKKLKKVRANSRLTEVLQLKHPLLNIRREINGKEFFSNLVPIFLNNQVVGAISTSIESTELKNYKDRLEQTEVKMKELKTKVYSTKYTFESIKGHSEPLQDAIQMAKKMAQSEATILIQGESGTGKELFAQSIHRYSSRRNEPFIPINCASLNTEMLESELFGYERGSFTGANSEGKNGVFVDAKGGTVFLDEIGELDISVQTKLLRVFQERAIRPLGSSTEIPIDVRIICASNRDLLRLVAEKKFKHDLFFRLATFTLSVPPLRERKCDILLLTEFFLDHYGCWFTMAPDFKNFLMNYEWPGNIRELQNVIEYCSAMTNNDTLTLDLLPNYLSQKSTDNQLEINMNEVLPLKEYTRKSEKHYIQKLLKKNGADRIGKEKTAEQLNISLATLYNKLDL